jgi:hypothetical protein
MVPAGGGTFSYSAHYNGADPYPGHDATNPACEPFSSPVAVFTGCTPGFWKNKGAPLWASLTKGLPPKMPAGLQFYQGTSFNSYFGLTKKQSGFDNSVTMIQALNSGGGGTTALARQAISALLSVAANLNYMYPPNAHDFTSLYNVIVSSFTTGNPSVDTLEQELDNANSKEDPVGGLC